MEHNVTQRGCDRSLSPSTKTVGSGGQREHVCLTSDPLQCVTLPTASSSSENSVNCGCAHPGHQDPKRHLLSSWEPGENVIWALFGLSVHSYIITLKCRFMAGFMYIVLVPRPPPFHRYIHNMSCRKYKLLIVQALSSFLNLSKGLFVKHTQMPFDRWGANCSVNYLYRFLFHVEPNKQKILMLWKKKWMMTFLYKHSLRSLIIGDSREQRSIAIAVTLWSL